MARGRGRSGRRSDYTWSGQTWFNAGLGAGQSLGNGSIAVVGAAGTIVRVRGQAVATMDVGAADDRMVVGLGLIVGSDDQFAAGAAAFPSPTDDLDGDWLWHGFFPLQSLVGTQGGEISQTYRLEVDSKAMRRVKQNDQIVCVADGVILAGSPTADVVAGFRVLFAT